MEKARWARPPTFERCSDFEHGTSKSDFFWVKHQSLSWDFNVPSSGSNMEFQPASFSFIFPLQISKPDFKVPISIQLRTSKLELRTQTSMFDVTMTTFGPSTFGPDHFWPMPLLARRLLAHTTFGPHKVLPLLAQTTLNT